ncbi:MAG: hypothetical protein V4592_11610 [Bacteroidota bacterium]
MSSISKYKAQKRLTAVWFIGSALLLLLILVWMIGDKFPNEDITPWVLQNVGPYLTLITTTFIVSYTQTTKQEDVEIDGFFYKLSVGATIFYFLVLFLILFNITIKDFHTDTDSLATVLKKTDKILPFFQSILGGILGVFFVKKK